MVRKTGQRGSGDKLCRALLFGIIEPSAITQQLTTARFVFLRVAVG